MSLKVVRHITIRMLGYGFLFAFYSNYGGRPIFSRFSDIQRISNGVTLKSGFEVVQSH